MHAVLFDLDGVLYQGENAIPGAAETMTWFTDRKIPYLFVTNTSSRPRTVLVEKLERFGIAANPADILTPAVAAVTWLKQHTDGTVGLFVSDATLSEFAGLPIATDDERGVGAVVIGDLGDGWSFERLNRAFRMLMADPQPHLLALGMTRYWRATDGLRLDTAPFVVALEHAANVKAKVFGKPAARFFQSALDQLGLPANDVNMIGDDIRSDIDAAQRLRIRGILVKTGKFRTEDLDLDITPWAVIGSITELPAWWETNG